MEAGSVQAIVRALNQAGVRYLVAGGLAVVAHGYVRFTKDIDLVLALEEANTRRALAALKQLGYRPMVPVPIEDFADAAKRRRWADEKNATVFPLYSDDHRLTPVELFVEEPFDFERAHADGLREEIAPGIEAVFVGLTDLIAMKRRAGRPEDLIDIAQLELINPTQ